MEQLDGIVPWDGTLGYPSFDPRDEVGHQAVLVPRSEPIAVPYTLVLRTNSTTWFALDSYQEQSYSQADSTIHDIRVDSFQQGEKGIAKSLHREKGEDDALKHETEPILPSFIDAYDDHSDVFDWSQPIDLNSAYSEDERLSIGVAITARVEKASSSGVMESLRKKLNEIIDNHNHISDEIGNIASVVVVPLSCHS